jgi:hypothetical protein
MFLCPGAWVSARPILAYMALVGDMAPSGGDPGGNFPALNLAGLKGQKTAGSGYGKPTPARKRSGHHNVKPWGSGVLVWLVLGAHNYCAYPDSP